jgi:multiple antibiotic resistance protein
MAIPLIAGPGAITTIIIHTQTLPADHIFTDKLFMTGIVIFLSLIIGCCFYFASWFNRVVSASAIQITTRIMGLILTAIAFDMLGAGLLHMFPGWA